MKKILFILAASVLYLTACLDNSASYDNDNTQGDGNEIGSSYAQKDPDTVYVIDTLKKEIVKKDTIIKKIRDTLVVKETKRDTVIKKDTVKIDKIKTDTLNVVDTIIVDRFDTVVVTNIDTVIVHDTAFVEHYNWSDTSWNLPKQSSSCYESKDTVMETRMNLGTAAMNVAVNRKGFIVGSYFYTARDYTSGDGYIYPCPNGFKILSTTDSAFINLRETNTSLNFSINEKTCINSVSLAINHSEYGVYSVSIASLAESKVSGCLPYCYTKIDRKCEAKREFFQHDTTIVSDTTVTMDTTSTCWKSLDDEGVKSGGKFDLVDGTYNACKDKFVALNSNDTLQVFSVNGYRFLLMFEDKESYRSNFHQGEKSEFWCDINIDRKRQGKVLRDSNTMLKLMKLGINKINLPYYTRPDDAATISFVHRNLFCTFTEKMTSSGTVIKDYKFCYTENGRHVEIAQSSETANYGALGYSTIREPDDVPGYQEDGAYRSFYVCDLGKE